VHWQAGEVGFRRGKKREGELYTLRRVAEHAVHGKAKGEGGVGNPKRRIRLSTKGGRGSNVTNLRRWDNLEVLGMGSPDWTETRGKAFNTRRGIRRRLSK